MTSPWHTGALEGANRRAAHVVNQLAGTGGRFASVLPCCAEGHDPFAIAMKYEPTDRAGRLQPFVLGKLVPEDPLQTATT